MQKGIELFDGVIKENLTVNKKFLFKRRSFIPRFVKLGKSLINQSKVRAMLRQDEDLVVPPIMILSITNDCNLSCSGCYACAQDREKQEELTIEEIDRVIGEAVELGVAIIMIAGGEPLIKRGILDVTQKHDDVLFVMFTNGLMIKGEILDKLKKSKNTVCAISLEGSREVTDERRGEGVYNAVIESMERLDKNGLLFASSFTLTSKNYDEVMDKDHLKSIQQAGSSAVFLIEYVPCQGDENLCLTDEQKDDLIKKVGEYGRELEMLLIPLPGNEDKYDGCLAAGRGFLHISSTGSVEACPFAPFSDVNVKEMPLKEALKSRLLKEVRDHHHLLKEGKGGCALVSNKEFVEGLVK